jgi:bifunctional DNase/RNase
VITCAYSEQRLAGKQISTRFSFPQRRLAYFAPAPLMHPMQSDVVKVAIKGVMPTSNGCALFLGPEDKTFIIYVDSTIGNTISMIVNQVDRERPMTHDLMANVFCGFGISLQRVIINDVKERTFFARIILKMENEIESKIAEIDARPSDAIALALRLEAPILVANHVLETEEDMTELLERILKEQE